MNLEAFIKKIDDKTAADAQAATAAKLAANDKVREWAAELAAGTFKAGIKEVLGALNEAERSVADLIAAAKQETRNVELREQIAAQESELKKAEEKFLEMHKEEIEQIAQLANALDGIGAELAGLRHKVFSGDIEARATVDELTKDRAELQQRYDGVVGRVWTDLSEVQELRNEVDGLWARLSPILNEAVAKSPERAPLIPLTKIAIATPSPKGLPPLESVRTLRDQGVSDLQICKIYGFLSPTGAPLIWQLQAELDLPGAVTTNPAYAWTDPRAQEEASLLAENEFAMDDGEDDDDEVFEDAHEEATVPAPRPRETLFELWQSKVPVAQSAAILGRSIESVSQQYAEFDLGDRVRRAATVLDRRESEEARIAKRLAAVR